MHSVLLLLLSTLLFTLAVAQPTLFTTSFNSPGGSQISTLTITGLPSNFINPIHVTLMTSVPSVQLCVQANFLPYPGELSNTCQSGGFGTFNGTNNATSLAPTSGTRKAVSLFEQSGNLQQPLASSPNTTAWLNLQPGATQYQAVISSNDTQAIYFEVSGFYCPAGLGPNCDTVVTALTETPTQYEVPANASLFFSLPVDPNTGSSTITVSATTVSGLNLYTALNTLPSPLLSTSPYFNNNSTTISGTILAPYPVNGGQWYAGVYNSNNASVNVSVSYSANVCNNTQLYGYNCQFNLTTDVLVVPFNATTFSAKKATDDSSANDFGLVYLTYNVTELNNWTANNSAPFVRFSVGPKSGVDSLLTFARLNAMPSASNFDLNGTMEYVSQVIFANPTAGNQWYFSVAANNDFWAWCGRNCYDCESHGHCVCDNMVCNDTTSFLYPTSLNDSFGMCVCDYSDYDESFNCMVNPNAFSPIYIVLIVIGGAIVIAVAIGVPLYCYLRSRKRASYDTI